MASRLKSIKENDRVDLKDSFQALHNIPRFLVEIKNSGSFLFYLNALCRLVSAISPVITLWIGKEIIDEIILQASLDSQDFTKLWWYVGIEVIVVIISELVSRTTNLTDGLLGDLYSNASSIKLIRKTNDLNISQLEDSDYYDKLERARTQTSSRVNLMSNSLSQIQDLIIIVTLIAALIFFEPWLIGLLVISIIPSFINEMNFSSSRYSLARSWTSERRELDYVRYIGANDKTAKETKLFGLTDFLAERFRRLSDQYYEANKSLAIRRSIYGSLLNILGILSYYGAYVLIIYRALNGVITIGELTFLTGSFRRLRQNLQNIFSRFTRISESALYLGDYFDYLDIEPQKAPDQPLQIPSEIKEGFEFRDLHFRYPGSENEVLKGINFKLHKGEKLAFVGENGAGKTTLIKLMLRFYEPTQGEILLDGINITNYDEQAYQKAFGVIFQDFWKYEFTLGENIGVGNVDEITNDAKIAHAAELSLAKDVVANMEDGYDQQLGKRFTRGKDLSGGQWQKVALARAYMKDAQVMILDEPTSALDAKAEFEVFERFIGLTKGKTSIIISHRFSTVRMADRIIVLKDGKIAENGTHKALMQNQELYAELFELQAAGYR